MTPTTSNVPTTPNPLLAPAGAPTAVQLSADVRAGRRTAVEVVEASLARIAEVNPTLRAFTVVTAESARAEAAAVDALAPAERGPLAGVPVAIKVESDVAGHVTTYGGRGFSTPATEDAEVVRRLRAAGAVVVGLTAMPEFGQFPFTESAAHGTVVNPAAPLRTPGGSSGGTAAAVASGCVPVALGGDGGGSIRIPAAACGLFGLKPTRGRTSAAPQADLWGALGVKGPLTRTPEDSALVYDVIRGTVAADRWSAADPARPYAEAIAERGPRRVAWLTQPPRGPVRVDDEVVAAVEATADRLAAAGHEVVAAQGRFPDVQTSFVPQFFASLRACVAGAEHPERLEARTRQTARMGAWATASVQRRAEAAGERMRQRFRQRFAGFDAVLSPTLACLPPELGRLDGVSNVRGLVRALPMIAFTTHANVTGLPAASLPAAPSREGLPIGVQLTGLDDDEGVLLALAAELMAGSTPAS